MPSALQRDARVPAGTRSVSHELRLRHRERIRKFRYILTHFEAAIGCWEGEGRDEERGEGDEACELVKNFSDLVLYGLLES